MPHFIDGCFDGFHYGHVHALFQAKQACDILVAGTHTDQELARHKSPPLFDFEQRKFMLRYCRFVDVLLEEGVPYESQIPPDCDKFAHGYEAAVNTATGADAMRHVRSKAAYYETTSGISTSNLMYRLFCKLTGAPYTTNLDHTYLNGMFEMMRPHGVQPSDQVVRVRSAWDMLQPQHIQYLLDMKTKYPGHKIECHVLSDDTTVLNELERAIALCGIALVDSVVLDGEPTVTVDFPLDPHMLQRLHRPKLEKQMALHICNQNLKAVYLDTGLYWKILEGQFKAIECFLQALQPQASDLIVLDLDEACLCNLGYTNNFEFAYLVSPFTHHSGMTPLIQQCQGMFKVLHEKCVNYAFITGRRERIRQLTEENLAAVGLEHYVSLCMCPDNFMGPIAAFKATCRKELSMTYTIIGCIGERRDG